MPWSLWQREPVCVHCRLPLDSLHRKLSSVLVKKVTRGRYKGTDLNPSPVSQPNIPSKKGTNLNPSPFSPVSQPSPRAPEQQAAAEQEQRQQEYHEGVAHDLAHVQACDRQQGDGPERLDHVGPLVAVGNG